MIVYLNKKYGSAHLLLKWVTKCHLSLQIGKKWKIQSEIFQSKHNSAALNLHQHCLFCLNNLLIHHKVTFLFYFPLQKALLPERLPEILEWLKISGVFVFTYVNLLLYDTVTWNQ